jgi:hypothetical protein
MDIAQPIRAQVLSDKEEPMAEQSSKDMDAPTRETPITANEEPIRAKVLTDRLLPTCTKSSTEIELANRDKLTNAREDPLRAKDRRDTEEPRQL